MILEGASRTLAVAANLTIDPGYILGPAEANDALRIAAKTFHPDAGGDPDYFRLLTQARDLLKGTP
jgi:hypothetical protein